MNIHPSCILAFALLAGACRNTDDTGEGLALGEVSSTLHETVESLVYIDWEQYEAGGAWVEFSTDGETWLSSPLQQVEPGPQRALLLGIPYDVEAQYRVIYDAGDDARAGSIETIQTGAQPEGVPSLEPLAATESAWDGDTHYVLGSIDETNETGVAIGTWSFVFDRQGRVVWAWETEAQRATIHPRVSWDGTDFLLDHNSFYAIFDGGAESQILRLKIDGTEVARYDTPGLHHPFTDTPDGSLLWGASQGYGQTLERLHPDGTQEQLWVCGDFYAEIGHSESYCASNTVTWDETSEHVLFSLYSSDSVVEIDPESGESLRWFGHLPDAWSFDPEDSAFWWQHGVHYTEAGTLLVSAKETENGDETVVREYELDEESQTLVQVWTFGDGEGVYGPEMGEAHRLGNGNTLHNYGSGARVREITPDGEVVWDLTFSSGTYLGRTTPLNDLYAFAP